MYMWDTRAMVPVESRVTKMVGTSCGVHGGGRGGSWKTFAGGGGNSGGSGKTAGGDGGKGGGVCDGDGGDGGGGGNGGEACSDGSVDDEIQVVWEVLEEDMHGASVANQQYNRKCFHTERAFAPFDHICTFNYRIRAIDEAQYTKFLEGFCIHANEQRVGEMTVTLHQDMPENSTFDEFINAVD